MASSSEPLAVIAGSSQMPCVVARQARRQGRRVTAVAIHGITEPAIDAAADDVRWLRWGDVPAFLRLLGKLRLSGVREAVMAGKVEQRRIFDADDNDELRSLLDSVPVRHTDALIGKVASVLAGAGITLLDCSDFLGDHLAPAGPLTRRTPDEREAADIEHGWRVAKVVGGLDIGQTVVVKDRAVVAIEAMEGTDACLRRAGDVAGRGTVVVKVAKPDQDLRFDLPVVGLGTLEVMRQIGATALAVQAGTTVIFDRTELVAAADAAEISVVGRQA